MMTRTSTWITVIEVIRGMGIEPSDQLDWRVGGLMAGWWKRWTGADPLKDNKGKTNGGGSHCFAHYPQEMRGVIVGFVKMVEMEKARQGDLFRVGEDEGIGVGEVEFEWEIPTGSEA